MAIKRNQRQRKKMHIAEFQELVKNWLTQNGLQQVEVSELFDIWWDYPTK